MSTPFRARAVFLALAGMTACVDVPEPDLTVRATSDAAAVSADAAPIGGRTGDLAGLGGAAPGGEPAPGADLDPAPGPPHDAGTGGTPGAPPDAGDPGDPRLAAQNNLGAAARVVAQEMPANVQEARALGCRVASREEGSILYGAFHFANRSLSSYVTPDADGNIEMILLARMPDWPAGERVRDLGTASLGLEEGARGGSPDHFTVLRGPTAADFEPFAVAADGTFETDPDFVSVRLPLLYGGQTIFTMQNATLRGRLVVDGPGFGVQQAFLEGYYTRDGVAESIRYMDAICSGSTPENWCGDFRLIVPRGACTPFTDPGACDFVVDALSLVVGGFDALVGPGVAPQSCSGNSCNAVGVCLALELEGVVLSDGSP
jgi:hypothetical protein